MIDLLVVGGGPAGLACGIHAARAGMSVTLVEPRRTPVDKACGEGIMPSGVAALREVGVEPLGFALRGIRYRDGQRRVQASFRHATGLGVRRTVLHAALQERARELGVEFAQGKVGEIRQEHDRVHAGGHVARWLIAADGLHSPIRRRLGLEVPDQAPSRWGLRRHFQVPPWTDLVEVYWSSHGEAYVTPVGPDQVGVAVLSRQRCGYAQHLAHFPDLASLLDAPAASEVRGAGPLRQRVRSPRAGRVLLVGDAAGYVDALTGEGISLALAGARAAIDCLHAGRPEAYPAALARLTRRHRLLTQALVSAARHPRGARLVVPAACRLPAVFAAVVRALQ